MPPISAERIMSEDDKLEETTTDSQETTAGPPTQAQLYDDLRRIGQLEDEKLAIQKEIDERTERLRKAIPSLDSDSLLCQMLTSCLKPVVSTASAAKKKAAKKRPSKRSTKKRT